MIMMNRPRVDPAVRFVADLASRDAHRIFAKTVVFLATVSRRARVEVNPKVTT